MQVLKTGLFLMLGVAAAACGGGSDGDGGGGDDADSGGSSNGGSSSGKGGSSNGGSSGKGGSSSGGSSSGGSSSGGSSSGGSSSGGTGNGGTSGGTSTGGAGGIDTTCSMAGYVSILTVPECKEFYTCYIEAICMESGGGQACVSQTLTIVKQSACYPSSAGVDLEMACEQARQSLATTYPQCAN